MKFSVLIYPSIRRSSGNHLPIHFPSSITHINSTEKTPSSRLVASVQFSGYCPSQHTYLAIATHGVTGSPTVMVMSPCPIAIHSSTSGAKHFENSKLGVPVFLSISLVSFDIFHFGSFTERSDLHLHLHRRYRSS